MSTPNPNNGDKIWETFKAKKVPISFAIDNLFPFLHGLRDAKIIHQKVFDRCKNEVTSNQKSIRESIYAVLENLEFSELAYKKIFCEENLDAYTKLQPIFQELNKEFQNSEKMSASDQRSNPGSSPKKFKMQKYLLQSIKDAEEISVSCGRAKGILFKAKFAEGVSKECIHVGEKWFTVKEFEIKGGRGTGNTWGTTICCQRHMLKTLIKKGYLPTPSALKKKKPVKKKPQQNPYTVDDFIEDMYRTFMKVHKCTQDIKKIEKGHKLYDDFEKKLSDVLE